MTITLQAVNELIQSLESAGELSIREQKFLKLAKAYQQLAAENVGLIRSAECLLHEASEVYRAYNKTQLPDGDLVDGQSLQEVWDAINATPATDAYLAGIKADGVEWIEGNEPSEFGRYWVRYETDTGPRYCSAQWMEYNFCVSSNTNIHKIWLADHSRSINSLKGVTHYTKLPAALEDQQLREGAK